MIDPVNPNGPDQLIWTSHAFSLEDGAAQAILEHTSTLNISKLTSLTFCSNDNHVWTYDSQAQLVSTWPTFGKISFSRAPRNNGDQGLLEVFQKDFEKKVKLYNTSKEEPDFVWKGILIFYRFSQLF